MVCSDYIFSVALQPPKILKTFKRFKKQTKKENKNNKFSVENSNVVVKLSKEGGKGRPFPP
jgi:hypothetical protein